MMKRFAVMIFAVLVCGTGVSAAEPESKELSHRYDAGSIRRVQIELPPSTRLQVRTSAAPVITIAGDVTVRFKGSPSKARRRAVLEGIDVVGEVESSNRLKIVDRRQGKARSGWARRLITEYDVTITVPEWTNVEVRQRSGAISVDGNLGDVSVGLRSGEISVVLPRARVRELSARARAGEVKADFGRTTEEREGLFPGETTYSNPSGQTAVRLNVTMGQIEVRLRE